MRANSKTLLLSALALLSAFLLSCASARKAEVQPPMVPEKMPLAEQVAASQRAFEDILEITATGSRDAALPKIEDTYNKIITLYPDAYYAQESYWRLIILNLEDYYPPRVEKAETYFREYMKKYPQPSLKYAVTDTMARFYYQNKDWQKLIDVCTPYITEYIKTGQMMSPLFLFFYSEGKFFLGDYVEANKGYRTLMRVFPGSHEARISERRLEEILSNY